MPTNLNALLRYKVIDECLRNRQINCRIDVLVERCSNAVSESMGQLKRISERTIREDIRILRSDTLGFNAPIIFENGKYLYKDSNFSIFNQSIKDINLLKQIQNLLVDNFEALDNNKNASYLLMKLAEITGEKLPLKCYNKNNSIFETKLPNHKTLPKTFKEELNEYINQVTTKRTHEKSLEKFLKLFKSKEISREYLQWNFILRVI